MVGSDKPSTEGTGSDLQMYFSPGAWFISKTKSLGCEHHRLRTPCSLQPADMGASLPHGPRLHAGCCPSLLPSSLPCSKHGCTLRAGIPAPRSLPQSGLPGRWLQGVGRAGKQHCYSWILAQGKEPNMSNEERARSSAGSGNVRHRTWFLLAPIPPLGTGDQQNPAGGRR